MTPEPGSIRVACTSVALQRHARMRWFAGALAAFGAVLSVLMSAHNLGLSRSPQHDLLDAWACAAPLVGLVGLAVAVWASLRPRRGWLTAGPDGLVVEKWRAVRVPARAVRGGWVAPTHGGCEVVFHLAHGDAVFAHVADVETGRGLLAAAGLDAVQRAVTLPLVSPATRAWWVPLGALVLAFPLPCLVGIAARAEWEGLFWCLVMVAPLFWLGGRLLQSREITVGAEGVVLHPGERFIPYADILGVWAGESAVTVSLRHGRVVKLAVAGEGVAGNGPRALAAAVATRIAQARAAARTASIDPMRLALLDRDGRPVDAWREALAGLLACGAYRGPGLSVEDLAALVEDTSAAVERRVAAALALRPVDDPAVQTRVRVAVETCARPAVRDALAAAARGELDEAALARAEQAAS